MDQQQAAAGQESLGPARGGRGRGGGGQLAGHPGFRRGGGDPARVQQQPGQPAGNERRTPRDHPGECIQPALAARGVGEQPGGRMHRVDAVPQGAFGRLVQGHHGAWQPGADPGDHLGGHLGEPGRIGAAHVAVPGRPDQGGQRRHQVGHVGVQRGPVPDRGEHGRQRVAEIGEQAPLNQSRQLLQRGGPGGERPGPLRGGGLNRAAPHARLDQGQVELGPPGQLPALAERADVPGPALSRRPPVHAEQGEPVQQVAAGQVVRFTQVQVNLVRRGLGPQPEAALLVAGIPLQRHHRGRGRHRAEPLADDQPPLDQGGEQVAALAQHRAGRLGDLLQARERPCRAARRAPRPAGRTRSRAPTTPGRPRRAARRRPSPATARRAAREDENRWSYQPGERIPAP